MKLTKEQLAAFNRLVAEEGRRRPHHLAGFHRSGDRCAVTDGYTLVMLKEVPDGLPDGLREDKYDELMCEAEKCDYYLVRDLPALGTLRKMPGKITLSAERFDGTIISSIFDVCRLVTTLEAAGTGYAAYLGFAKPFSKIFASLMVYSKAGVMDSPLTAVLLPCRY